MVEEARAKINGNHYPSFSVECLDCGAKLKPGDNCNHLSIADSGELRMVL